MTFGKTLVTAAAAGLHGCAVTPSFLDSAGDEPAAALSPEQVLCLTRTGEQQLQAAATSLSPTQIELLVLLDGQLPLAQVRRLMPHTDDAAFDAAVRFACAQGLAEPARHDALAFGLHQDLARMQLAAAQAEADSGIASLRRRGYYVRIARERAAPRQAQGPLHCVVVEDDPVIARFLQTFLALEGFSVRLATDRASATAQLSCRPVADVILLDVMLPDVDGFEILRKLGTHPVLGRVPVIMLTASDSREAVLRGVNGGAAGYLTKPVDPESLLQAVRTVAGLPQPARSQDPWAANTLRQRGL